ncbi:hypothetical protein GCM10010094_27880 [Streptomyces flaveus]|uniref:Uncharacterized protein n=1 Tax=Streptomyces flaveus TaxID=66370 RepID=A0A917VDD4_9ACTN|nr:hypothetical protein GCM10010094_27880 [Streptomyces flaveus]
MCRSLHCAYLLAHHTPVQDKGNPYGPSTGCVRVHTAPINSMGMAWGWRRLAILSRVLLAASVTGGWGTVVGG